MIQRILLLTLSLAISARADVILDALRWFPPEAEAVAAVRGPSEIGWSLLKDLIDVSTEDDLRRALGALRVHRVCAKDPNRRLEGPTRYSQVAVLL
jgi:hypothetical protein